MEQSNSRKLILSIIGVAALLLAVAGSTYAWFSSIVSGTGSTMTVTTANLGTITFVDGASISVSNWYPGDSTTKQFTIVSDPSATIGVAYTVGFVDVTNTYAVGTDLVYSLSGSGNGNGGMLVSASNVTAPTSAGAITGDGVLGVGETHTYQFTLLFKEMSTNQNSNQGASFAATLEVTSSGKYTAGGSTYNY